MSKPTDIELSVGLSAADIKQSAKDLNKAIKDIFDKSAGKELDKSMQSLQKRMSETASKASTLQEKMAKLETTKIPTKEYNEVSKRLDRMNRQFNVLLEEQRQLEQAGVTSGAAWDRIDKSMERLGILIREDENELQQLVETGKAFTLGSNTAEYDKLAGQLAEVNNQSRILINSWDNMSDEEEEVVEHSRSLSSVWTSIMSLLHKAGNVIRKVFHGISNAVKGAINIMRKLATVLKGVVTKIWSMATAMRHTNQHVGSFGFSLKRMLGSMLALGLGIQGLRSLFTKLRSAAVEGVQALVQWEGANGRLNKSISSVISAIATLKNSVGAMIAPLINALAPALTYIINLLTTATQKIGQFIAALTGQKTFLVANEVQQDYAASLDKTAKNAKKAEKALKGYLSPIDEINKYESKQDEDAAGGGGVGGAGFTSKPIDQSILDLIKKLKDMWKNADFTDLGKALGEKLLKALQSIPWAKIKRNAAKLGKSIATFINGFVEVPELGNTLGKTIAEALNTAFWFLDDFVKHLHWKSIGRFIADTFNGFFKNIEWNKIRSTVVNGMKGIADAINEFVDTFDWDNISTTVSNAVNIITSGLITFLSETDFKDLGKNLGEQFRKSIEQIEWKDIGKTLGLFLKDAIDFAIEFLQQQSWDTVKQAIRDLIEGFLEGLGVDESRIDTIMSWVDKVGEWLEKAYKWVSDVWTELQPILSEIWDAVEPLIEDLGQRLMDWLSELPGKLEELKKTDAYQSFISKLKELTAQDIIDGLQNLGTALGVIIGLKITSDIVSNFSGLFGALTSVSGTGLTGIAVGIGAIALEIKGLNEVFLDDAPEQIKDRYSGLTGVINALRDEISMLINGFQTGVFAPDKRAEDDMMAYNKALEECSVAIDKITGSGDNMKAFWQADDGIAGFFGKWKEFDASSFDDIQREFQLTDEQVGSLKKAMIDATYESGTYQGSLKQLAEIIGYIPEKYEDMTKATTVYKDAQGNVTAEYNRWGERIIRVSDDTANAVVQAKKKEEEALAKEVDQWNKSHISIMQEEQMKVQGVTNARQHIENEKTQESNTIKANEEITQKAIQDTRKIFEEGKITIQTTTDANAAAVTKNGQTIIEEEHKIEEAGTGVTQSITGQWKERSLATEQNAGAMAKATTDANDEMNKSTADTTKAMSSSWTSMTDGIKSAINSILGFVEKMVNGIIDAFNKMGDVLGDLDIDVPDWIPEIGGKKFQLGLPSFSHISIPRLAQGAVIPPNKQFMAVLGDQKQGTNIETPLSTMIDAFNTALAQSNVGSQPITLNLMLPDKRTVAQYAIEGGQVLQMSRGYNPFLLERG